MPTRRAKAYSDRGSLKDLINRQQEPAEPECPPTPFELRLKKLYEYGQVHKDQQMLASSGFITTDYISDKNAIPLSVYRLRKIVEDCKSHSLDKIQALEQQFVNCLGQELSSETIQYINQKRFIKSASSRKPPVFRRVSE